MESETSTALFQTLPWVLYSSLGILAIWEFLAPRKPLQYSRIYRWLGNGGLYFSNATILRLIPFLGSVGAAQLALTNSIGILYLSELPLGFTFLATIALYDCWQYFKHRLFHSVPVLWKLHRVHHSDPDVDITTEFKHHPLEILVSNIFDVFVVIALGLHPIALLVRLLVLAVISTLSHANVKISKVIEKPMRWIFITPDMHRIHHSVFQSETDSNFSSLLSIWDRIFSTYTYEPKEGQDSLTLGLEEFREERDVLLHNMLAQPFVRIDLAETKATDNQAP